MYDRERDTGGVVGYTMNFSGTDHTVCPNLARTHFAMLLKECCMGYRSTFNWRFTSLGNNGVDVEYMAVERVNAAINTGVSYIGRIASVPSPLCLSPYADDTHRGGDASFPDLSQPSNVIVRPLSFNQGSSVSQGRTNFDYPAWTTKYGTSGSGFGVNTMLELRKRFNSLVVS